MILPRKFWFDRKFNRLGGIFFTSLALLIIFYSYHNHAHIYPKQGQKPSERVGNLLQYTSTPRILCLILTTPKYFLTRAKAVNDTWAPRCDRYFFVTEPSRESAPFDEVNFAKRIPIASIKNITPGYGHLTHKSTSAFLFAYENYFNDYDWFVKADDDTYLFVDHLKLFLSDKKSSEPVTYGYNFKVNIIAPPIRRHQFFRTFLSWL